MEKTSLELMLKGIVKEALTEVLQETGILKGAIKVAGIKEALKEATKNEPKKEEKAKKQEAKVEEPEVEADEEVGDDRRAELKAMKYNDLKKLVKELGGKAVGSADSIIEQILELEESADDSEEDEEETDEAQEEATADEDDAEEDEEDSDEEDDESEAEYKEFLMGLEKDELLKIGKELGNPKPKNWKKETFVDLLLVNIEQLEEALDKLGYFDDEEDSDEDSDDIEPDDVDEDSEEEDEEEDEEESVADQLSDMSLEDLATLCTDNGLSAKGKKQALIDRIVKAVDAGKMTLDGDDSEEEEDDEWYTQEELDDMSDEDLKDIADTNEIEVPMKGKGKNKKMDRNALIESILALGEAEDEEDVEDESDDSEEEEEDFEVSEERIKAQEEIDADIRKKYKGKKLKDNTIKKFLEKYNEGNPKYALPESKEEALEEYIDIHVNLVDDDADVHDMEDCYVRDGEYHCCGSLLDELENGTPYCPVCGTEYEAE
jgi:hypothetical protein